jgi:hypothetical protein
MYGGARMSRIAIGLFFVLVIATIWKVDRHRQYQHGFAMGEKAVQLIWDKTVQDQQQKALQVSFQVERSQAEAQEKIRTVYQTITTESIRYVQTHPTTCRLDDDWLRIHDAAASGDVDSATGKIDGAS